MSSSQPLQPLPPMPRADSFAAGSTVPPPRKLERLKIMVLGAASIAILVLGIGIGIASQSGHISRANQAATAAQSSASSLQTKLAASQTSNAGLEAQVSDQQNQLAACSDANSLSTRMDNVQHKLLNNVLDFGSVFEFDSLGAQYRALGSQWADAANICDPTGGYSFG
jgi:hypothetical protein